MQNGAMRYRSITLAFALALCGCAATCAAANAQSVDANGRPAVATLRDEEDWTFLRDPAKRTDALDALKFVEIGNDPNEYVVFGAELREFYEHYFDQNWLAPNGSNGYDLQRYLLDADFHAGRARVFSEIESALDEGRKGGSGINLQDRLDATALYAQWSIGGKTGTFAAPIAVQAGRMEFNYGSGALLAANDGPGIRNSFDGTRVVVRDKNWRYDALAAYYVTPIDGIFASSTDHTRSLTGVYVQRSGLGRGALDFFFLDDSRKHSTYERGSGAETRYTAGARGSRTFGRFDGEFDGGYQFGRFAAVPIVAGFVAGNFGYTIGSRTTIRPYLQGGIGTGDGKPGGPLGTFRPPTFKGQYVGAIGADGPSNVLTYEPGVTVNSGKVIGTAEFLIFDRESGDDGVYGIAGNLLVRGRALQPIGEGVGPLFSLLDRVGAHTTAQAIYQRYLVGPFLKTSAPNDSSIAYYRLVLDYKF